VEVFDALVTVTGYGCQSESIRVRGTLRLTVSQSVYLDESESESYVITDSLSASFSWNKAPICGLMSESYVTTDSQSASLSWNKALIWGYDQIFITV
jgi:hypothetical protein